MNEGVKRLDRVPVSETDTLAEAVGDLEKEGDGLGRNVLLAVALMLCVQVVDLD